MSLPQTQTHAVNAAAAAGPMFLAWVQAPETLTVLTAVLGIIWYCILIGEKIVSMVRRYRGSQETKQSGKTIK
jgi:hypothetical protein